MEKLFETDPAEPAVYMPDKIPCPDVKDKVVVMLPGALYPHVLREALDFGAFCQNIFGASIYTNSQDYPYLVFCTDFIGAPLATMLMEIFVYGGARKFLHCGACGSLDPQMGVGTIFLPSAALSDEGSARFYSHEKTFIPDSEYHRTLKAILNTREQRFESGVIVSTDSIFRETPSRIQYYMDNDCRGLDMTTSALLAAGAFHKVKIGSINVISDTFYQNTWFAGTLTPEFNAGRQEAIEVIKEMVVWMHTEG